MSNFKVGDKVRIVANVAGSVNEIGDVGVVTEHNDNQTYTYRVKVGDRFELSNWSFESDLELVTENTLQVGQTYTSENGMEWECIFVRNDMAWMAVMFDGSIDGSAYVFNIDGTNISQGGGSYNIKWGPWIETYRQRMIRAKGGEIREATLWEKHDFTLEYETIDGTPDWSTAKVSPCD